MGLLATDKTLDNPQPHSEYHPKFLRKLSKDDDLLASGARHETDRNGSLNDSGSVFYFIQPFKFVFVLFRVL